MFNDQENFINSLDSFFTHLECSCWLICKILIDICVLSESLETCHRHLQGPPDISLYSSFKLVYKCKAAIVKY